MELIPVIHNVSSVQRVVDMARLVYSLGLELLIVSKAYGGAAQSGVPEAMKIAMKTGKSLVVLPGLGDVVDLLKPDNLVAVTRSHAEKLVDPLNPPVYEGRTLIVFSGGEPEFTPSEIAGAEKIYLRGVETKLGPIAEAAIILYILTRRRHQNSSNEA